LDDFSVGDNEEDEEEDDEEDDDDDNKDVDVFSILLLLIGVGK
jgi:hypothetical protein